MAVSGERILQTAARLFQECGAGSVGMREIARAAGVSVGTLYNYYRDKEALTQAIAEQAVDKLMRRLRLERLNPGRPLQFHLQSLVAGACEVAPLFAVPEQLANVLAPAFLWAIEDAQVRGELPRAAEPSALAELLAATVAGTIAVLPPGSTVSTGLPTILTQLLSGGIAAAAAANANDSSVSDGAAG